MDKYRKLGLNQSIVYTIVTETTFKDLFMSFGARDVGFFQVSSATLHQDELDLLCFNDTFCGEKNSSNYRAVNDP